MKPDELRICLDSFKHFCEEYIFYSFKSLNSFVFMFLII